MTARSLARRLTAAGIAVLGHSERDEAVDAEVRLAGNVSVQIAGSRLVLNQWVEDDESVWHLGEFRSVAALVAALQHPRPSPGG